MSRTPDQVWAELAAILPTGWAQPSGAGSYNAALYWPLAAALSDVEGSMETYQTEIDPRSANALLPDFERVLGPDPCGRDQLALTTSAQQALAYQRWTAGGQTMCAGFFEREAVALGVAPFAIEEFPAYTCGASPCGASTLVQPPNHMTFLVTLPTSRVQLWVCGATSCDESLGTFTPNLMQCLIDLQKPVQTAAYFKYVSPV